jgi:putative Ca2+/H+ antiporter (TMEM165/GDT1 family)
MEALLPALIAVFLAELDGRVQYQSEALVRHFARPRLHLAVLALTTLASLAFAAIGGWLVIKHMNWNARSLLAGLALIVAGVTMLWPHKPPAAVTGTSALGTSLWRYVVNQFGDNSQFIVFAIAAWARVPGATLVAGLIGVLAAASFPLFLPYDWRKLAPWSLLRKIAAALMLLAGLWAAKGALA